jgi:uncharacterized BrkB/YihY/UPF0761 family membrane protein
MGALINLNHPAHYISWHFFQMSVPNAVVIVLMLVVFCAALYLRAPGARKPRRPK